MGRTKFEKRIIREANVSTLVAAVGGWTGWDVFLFSIKRDNRCREKGRGG